MVNDHISGIVNLILPIIFVMTGLGASSDMGVSIAINRRAADVADLAPHVHPVVCTYIRSTRAVQKGVPEKKPSGKDL